MCHPNRAVFEKPSPKEGSGLALAPRSSIPSLPSCAVTLPTSRNQRHSCTISFVPVKHWHCLEAYRFNVFQVRENCPATLVQSIQPVPNTSRPTRPRRISPRDSFLRAECWTWHQKYLKLVCPINLDRGCNTNSARHSSFVVQDFRIIRALDIRDRACNVAPHVLLRKDPDLLG